MGVNFMQCGGRMISLPLPPVPKLPLYPLFWTTTIVGSCSYVDIPSPSPPIPMFINSDPGIHPEVITLSLLPPSPSPDPPERFLPAFVLILSAIAYLPSPHHPPCCLHGALRHPPRRIHRRTCIGRPPCCIGPPLRGGYYRGGKQPPPPQPFLPLVVKIGRASCRERV